MNNGIIDDIVDSLKIYAGNTAFVIDGKAFTYQRLGEEINRILPVLSEKKEQNIGIMADNCIETYAAILAVLISGKTYVILHPSYPEERNIRISGLAGLKTLLTKGTLKKSTLSGYIKDIVDLSSLEINPENPAIECKAEDGKNAYIIFTSGSTGEPKGVPISHKNLNAFYKAYGQLGLELDEHDRTLQMFELTFDVSVVSTLYPLTLGASIYTVGYKDMKHFKVFDLLESERLTFATVTPSLLQLLSLYIDEIHLPYLRYLVLTAEASQSDLINHFKRAVPDARFINLYGPTEATIYCCKYNLPGGKTCKQHNGMVAIGQPFPGIEVLITDSEGKELPQGKMGELWVSGEQVMAGYINNPEKNKEVLVNRNGKIYYRTGDLCILDKDGDLIYCGRMDHQVKIQGYRIELSEIEYAAKMFYSNSCNAVAFPIKVQGICNELMLVVESKADNKNDLMKYLKQKLPTYMMPNNIQFIPHFPVTSSNKIDRKKISELVM